MNTKSPAERQKEVDDFVAEAKETLRRQSIKGERNRREIKKEMNRLMRKTDLLLELLDECEVYAQTFHTSNNCLKPALVEYYSNFINDSKLELIELGWDEENLNAKILNTIARAEGNVAG